MALSTTDAARPSGIRKAAAWDGVSALSLFVLLLFAVPSRLTFAALGGAGSPAMLVGMAGAVLWVWYRLSIATDQPLVAQPVRRAAFLLAAALVASFAAGMVRAINANEVQASQRSLLIVLGWLGVLLVATDGIVSTSRMDALLKRISLAVGLFAALAVAQYVTGLQLTNYIVIPGLSANQVLSDLATRDGLNRPASTAIHPIEFGVTITCLLPICLHVALHSKGIGWFRRWAPVAVVGVAVPLSVSRSAVVGAAVSLVVLVPAWPSRLRTAALACLGVLGGIVFVAFPGIIGTLTGLFTGAATDPSALSRTDSYGLAGEFIAQAPAFGRGFGTFLPQYRILDNQYLGLAIDAGLLGCAALVGMFVTAIVCAYLVRRRLVDPAQRHLGQALVASVSSAAVGYALFDGFSFPIFAGVTFLLVGLCGAFWRVHATDGQAWLRG